MVILNFSLCTTFHDPCVLQAIDYFFSKGISVFCVISSLYEGFVITTNFIGSVTKNLSMTISGIFINFTSTIFYEFLK